jgi:hypothetical protein
MRYSLFLVQVAFSSLSELTIQNFQSTLNSYVARVENTDILYLMPLTRKQANDENVLVALFDAGSAVSATKGRIHDLPYPTGLNSAYSTAYNALHTALAILLGETEDKTFPSQASIAEAISECSKPSNWSALGLGCDESLTKKLRDINGRIFELRTLVTRDGRLPRVLLEPKTRIPLIKETRKLQEILITMKRIAKALKQRQVEFAKTSLSTLKNNLEAYPNRQSFYWIFQNFLENEVWRLSSRPAFPINQEIPFDILLYTMSFMDRTDGLSLFSSLISQERDETLPKLSEVYLSKEETRKYLTDQDFYGNINTLVEIPDMHVRLNDHIYTSPSLTLEGRQITALTPAFGRLEDLVRLDLKLTPVVDLSALCLPKRLWIIKLIQTPFVDLSTLTCKGNLRELSLKDVPNFVDVSSLASLENLEIRVDGKILSPTERSQMSSAIIHPHH